MDPPGPRIPTQITSSTVFLKPNKSSVLENNVCSTSIRKRTFDQMNTERQHEVNDPNSTAKFKVPCKLNKLSHGNRNCVKFIIVLFPFCDRSTTTQYRISESIQNSVKCDAIERYQSATEKNVGYGTTASHSSWQDGRGCRRTTDGYFEWKFGPVYRKLFRKSIYYHEYS